MNDTQPPQSTPSPVGEEAKTTPGPWRAVLKSMEGVHHRIVIESDALEPMPLYFPAVAFGLTEDEAKANAELIAEAPTLRTSLEECWREINIYREKASTENTSEWKARDDSGHLPDPDPNRTESWKLKAIDQEVTIQDLEEENQRHKSWIATIEHENEIYRTEYQGKAVAMLHGVFDLCGRLGFGGSSRPPSLDLEQLITKQAAEVAELRGQLVQSQETIKTLTDDRDAWQTANNLSEIGYREIKADLATSQRETEQAKAEVVALRETLEKIQQLRSFQRTRIRTDDEAMGFDIDAAAYFVLSRTSASYASLTTIPIAELAELRKDRKRLDWLFFKDCEGDFGTPRFPHQWNYSENDGWCCYTVGDISEKPCFSTLRAAIDNAMKEPPL